MLNRRVLILNRLWQAINVVTARRAFSLVYQGHAKVVAPWNGSFRTFDFDEWRCFSQEQTNGGAYVHTVSYRLLVPSIVVLGSYDKLPQQEVKFTRKNIFGRDGCRCQYCGRVCDPRDLNIDHVIPISRGGKTTWTNVVTSCIDCNRKKGHRTPWEAGMRLIRKPRKPRWRPYPSPALRIEDESWKHFLDPDAWNVELGLDDEVATTSEVTG